MSERMLTPKQRGWVWAICAASALIAVMAPAYPQPESYHQFAHDRSILGIPNFWNVITNVPFLLVALVAALRLGTAEDRSGGAVFIAGVFLTGLGSGYYHWHPTTETLFWDRLPMTIAFSATVAGLVGRRINARFGHALLWPLAAISAATVLYWKWSESVGRGNLVPYGMVQFGAMAAVVGVLIAAPEASRAQRHIWMAFGFYLLAKILEGFDRQIGGINTAMGGHPIKHVAAAIGCWFIWLGVFDARSRDPIKRSPSTNP